MDCEAKGDQTKEEELASDFTQWLEYLMASLYSIIHNTTYAMGSLPRSKRRSRLDKINEVLRSYAPGDHANDTELQSRSSGNASQ